MKAQILKSNIMLLLTAAIWGSAFVAQRVGAQYIGSFTFNGVRFALGSLSLLPLIIYYGKRRVKVDNSSGSTKEVIFPGFIAGSVLFIAASLQQVGMEQTTAGKAAFITGLYIVLVPILGIFLKHKTGASIWAGAGIALIGLYLLSVTETFTIENGDLLELIGSFFWAIHILVIDRFSRKVDVLKLSFIQFATCSLLSLITAFSIETISLSGLQQAIVPILYGGVCSVGIAYTLQVVAQRHARASHAAIILSLETVFAVIGGYLMLNESLTARGMTGCALMLAGMLLSQLQGIFKASSTAVLTE